MVTALQPSAAVSRPAGALRRQALLLGRAPRGPLTSAALQCQVRLLRPRCTEVSGRARMCQPSWSQCRGRGWTDREPCLSVALRCQAQLARAQGCAFHTRKGCSGALVFACLCMAPFRFWGAGFVRACHLCHAAPASGMHTMSAYHMTREDTVLVTPL